MEAADYSEKSSTRSEERDPGLPPTKLQKQLAKITFFLTRWGVETNGYVYFRPCVLQQVLKYSMSRRIEPIPEESRTDPKMFQMFFTWFSANMNVLGYVKKLSLSAMYF